MLAIKYVYNRGYWSIILLSIKLGLGVGGGICEKSMSIIFRFGAKRSGCELWSGIGREASCWRLSMCIIEDI